MLPVNTQTTTTNIAYNREMLMFWEINEETFQRNKQIWKQTQKE